MCLRRENALVEFLCRWSGKMISLFLVETRYVYLDLRNIQSWVPVKEVDRLH